MRDDGFRFKYVIQKADGSPCDPDAAYFVLRLDDGGDPDFVLACRKALREFAISIRHKMPQLASDLDDALRFGRWWSYGDPTTTFREES